MSNGVIVCTPPGCYLGNATMSYLHARAHAERVGAELQMDGWIGEEIFDVPVNRVTPENRNLPRRSSFDLKDDETNVEIRCYSQSQAAMIYTRRQAQDWLRFKHSIEDVFSDVEAMEAFDSDDIVCHLRRTDYGPLGYPLVSRESYFKAIMKFTGYANCHEARFLEWDKPTARGKLPESLFMLPDFMRLVYAPFLFRANSTFSWLAGVLNTHGRVFAPIMEPTMLGGQEHDCRFIEGNWPMLTDRAGGTNLVLKGEPS